MFETDRIAVKLGIIYDGVALRYTQINSVQMVIDNAH